MEKVKNIRDKNEVKSGKKILIVEDSQVIQNITKNVLEFYKHEVQMALDGKEALELIENEYFDVILMDIAMPNMDGIECVRRIRLLEDEKKSNVPIIAVTGNADFLTPVEFKKIGFTSFIEKPVNFDNMSKILKNYI